MATNYLSIDTEATGLTEECVLIQLAFVPVDNQERRVLTELGVEWLVQCKSYEELEPTLNPWVRENNKELIQKAHAEGLTHDALRDKVEAYLLSEAVQKVFVRNGGGKSRPILLGKSLSALDLPLLTRTFGKAFMDRYFHHHTLDITCITRFLVDSGTLPKGCESTSGLLPHFNIRDEASHTALNDALDMGQVYLKLLKMGLRATT